MAKNLQEIYLDWVDDLNVNDSVQSKLRQLSPLSYLGLSEKIAEKVLGEFRVDKT